MEIKDLLPIAGVAIGWGLSEVAGTLKARSLRRRMLRKAITSLYKLNFEMIEVKGMQEHYKNSSSNLKHWEHGRQRSFETYADNSDAFHKEIDDAISLISEDFPLMAFQLSQFVKKYRYIKTRKLGAFVGQPKVYMTMLSGLETGQLGAQHIIESTILKIALKIDVLLWWSLYKNIKKFKKTIAKGDLVHGSQVVGMKKTDSSDVPESSDASQATAKTTHTNEHGVNG